MWCIEMKAGEYVVKNVERFCKNKYSAGYRNNPYVFYDACINCPLSKQKLLNQKHYKDELFIECTLDLIPRQLLVKRAKR